MPRVKSGTRRSAKHRKILKLTKGMRMSRNRLFKRANEAVTRMGEHAFAGRKQRKRDMRRLWIARINSALTNFGINYSRFIPAMKRANIQMDRKMLADLAIKDFAAFEKVVEVVKKSL
jgi:large subunit ribosomal protein L20